MDFELIPSRLLSALCAVRGNDMTKGRVETQGFLGTENSLCNSN